jgi:VanZ family protein
LLKFSKYIVFVIFYISCAHTSLAQQKSLRLFNENDSLKGRKQLVVYGGLGAAAGVHTLLYTAWYKNYPRGGFQFIDDSKEWLQMDKMGHAFSAYYLGVISYETSLWAGYSPRKAARNGVVYATLFQTMIEVFDGFSTQWGASLSDVLANSAGSALFWSQAYVWNEQRVTLKYNFLSSPYASLRPNLLGNGRTQTFLKDYNGQVYWLSFNPFTLLQKSNKLMPRGINLALGYGATGMLGAHDNIWVDNNGMLMDYSHIQRGRRYYLSIDIDWIDLFKPKNQYTKLILTALNCIKVPLPSIGFYNDNGLKMSGHVFR